jgi:outer membrane protein TolC
MVVRFISCFFTLVVVAGCLPGLSYSQVYEAAFEDLEVLTSEALVAEVELHNHHILSSAAAVEAAQIRVEPASALADPTLSYMMLPRSIGSDIGFRQGGEISQSFPWPGKRDLRGAVAAQQRNIAREDQAITRLDVVAAAKSSFAEWHYLHRAVEINAASKRVVEELIAVAQARYVSGRALQQDVLLAEVELVLVEQQRLALDQQLRSARASMNLLLNRDIDARIPPPAPLPDPGPLPGLAAARTIAEQTHPYLRRQAALIDEGNARVELADKAFLPDFRAYLSYADVWEERDKRLHVGIAINVPIGRDKRHAELDAVRAEVRRDEHELEGHRQTLLAEMETAYAETLESLASMQLYEERLMPLAQASLDISLSDYRNGVGQFINVVAAERQQLSTEQGYERTRADYWRRRAALERAAGVPLADGARSPAAFRYPTGSTGGSPFLMAAGEDHE